MIDCENEFTDSPDVKKSMPPDYVEEPYICDIVSLANGFVHILYHLFSCLGSFLKITTHFFLNPQYSPDRCWIRCGTPLAPKYRLQTYYPTAGTIHQFSLWLEWYLHGRGLMWLALYKFDYFDIFSSWLCVKQHNKHWVENGCPKCVLTHLQIRHISAWKVLVERT